MRTAPWDRTLASLFDLLTLFLCSLVYVLDPVILDPVSLRSVSLRPVSLGADHTALGIFFRLQITDFDVFCLFLHFVICPLLGC